MNEETRRVVQRYDAALQQISILSRENRNLKEQLREKEIKVMSLIAHYQDEIESQTRLVSNLKNELRANDVESYERRQNVRDKCTSIEHGDLESRETDLQNRVYELEDEVQSLKDKQIKQSVDFERKMLLNEANVKQSFEGEVDTIRQLASEAVCGEVRNALEETLSDNERLTREFRAMLHEMEKLQDIRETKDKELAITRRELDFMVYKGKLLACRRRSQLRHTSLDCADDDGLVNGNSVALDDTSPGEHKALGDNPVVYSLEDYFKQCLNHSKC